MLGEDTVEKPEAKPDEENESAETMSRRALVKRWQERVRQAKARWEDDFERMRNNEDFVGGFQYKSQPKLEDDRYIANFTIRMINQKVATLYARNPEVVANRRKRLDFQLWDGKMETIQQAVGAAMMGMQNMGMVPPEALALMNDFQRGRQMQEMADRVGKTLEIVFKYQMDTQEPDFKLQLKQLVRRVCVCGVGYIKVIFCRDYENDLTQTETRQSPVDRAKRAMLILKKIEEGKIDENDAEVEQLRSLVASLGPSPIDHESVAVNERLIFDFPPATAVIPDPQCHTLKGFVGGHFVAEQFIFPLDYVNAMYETDIKPGGEVKLYSKDGQPDTSNTQGQEKDNPTTKPLVCLWEVQDLDSKSKFILCDGHKDFVQEPEPISPATKSFWNLFPLTFNDVESEPGCKTTIFPPSDVQLVKPVQREHNRTRQALRAHRRAKAPKNMVPKGVLTENDKDKLENAEDNAVIELEGLPPGMEPGKVLQPLMTAPIEPEVYDTSPLAEDSLLVSGNQEANIGPAQPNVTATVGTIAEQSRMTVASSNVDDLDDCLSAVARCGGEMLLQEMSTPTVQRIVGVGTVWPEQNKQEFLNQIELEVVAASSGRPNKAIEVANFERMAPVLIQAGANPQAVIREAVKRLDDRMDPADFFPVAPPALPPGTEGSPSGGNPPPPKSAAPGPTPSPAAPVVGG